MFSCPIGMIEKGGTQTKNGFNWKSAMVPEELEHCERVSERTNEWKNERTNEQTTEYRQLTIKWNDKFYWIHISFSGKRLLLIHRKIWIIYETDWFKYASTKMNARAISSDNTARQKCHALKVFFFPKSECWMPL